MTAVSKSSGDAEDPFMTMGDLQQVVVGMAPHLGLDAKELTVQAIGDLFNRKYITVYREPAERIERREDRGRTSTVRLFSRVDAFKVGTFLGVRQFRIDVTTAKAITEFAVGKWYPKNSEMGDDALQLAKDAPMRPRDMAGVFFHEGKIVLSDGSDGLEKLTAMAKFRPVLFFNLARVLGAAKLHTEALWEKRAEEVAALLKHRKRLQDVAAAEEGNMRPGISVLRSPLRLRLTGKGADGQLHHVTEPLSPANVIGLAVIIAKEKGKGDRSSVAMSQETPGLYAFGDPTLLVGVGLDGDGDIVRIGFSLTDDQVVILLERLRAALAGEEIAASQFDAKFLSAMRISRVTTGTAEKEGYSA